MLGRTAKSKPIYLDRNGHELTSGTLVKLLLDDHAVPAMLYHNKRQGHWRTEDASKNWRLAQCEFVAEANLYWFPEIERR